MPLTKRLNNIDGWRAIACLGVLYGHVLGTLGSPKWVLGGIDWLMVMNLWGYGVHLFFVISGLCFYLVLDKQNEITKKSVLQFWKKRWLRIAPAYYVAVLVYAMISQGAFDLNLFRKVIINFLFIQPYLQGMEISAIFWSLSVECFFYLILPFLFLCIRRIGLGYIVIFLILSGCIFNGLHYAGYLASGNNSWYYQFPANYAHFAWGILIGYLYKNEKLNHRLLQSLSGLILGLGMAYLGKLSFYSGAIRMAEEFGWLLNTIGPLLMTLGFSVMILVSLRNVFLSKIIGNPILSFVGRISYSFYLWHALLLGLIYNYFNELFSSTPTGVVLLFILSAIIIVPVSWLSYQFFEAFYFSNKNHKA